MAATAASWIRRLSRDHQSSSTQNEQDDIAEDTQKTGKRFSAISISNNTGSAVHPHHANKHGPPPNSSRSRVFLNFRRRFSLPVCLY